MTLASIVLKGSRFVVLIPAVAMAALSFGLLPFQFASATSYTVTTCAELRG